MNYKRSMGLVSIAGSLGLSMFPDWFLASTLADVAEISHSTANGFLIALLDIITVGRAVPIPFS